MNSQLNMLECLTHRAVLGLSLATIIIIPLVAGIYEQDRPQVVYKSYMRRNKSPHPDQIYVDEIFEQFHMRQRPLPFPEWNDEQLHLIIRCDYDMNQPECQQVKKYLNVHNRKPAPLLPPRVNNGYDNRPNNDFSNEEVELAIRCDFEPDLPECVNRDQSSATTTTTRSIPATNTATPKTLLTPTTTSLPFFNLLPSTTPNILSSDFSSTPLPPWFKLTETSTIIPMATIIPTTATIIPVTSTTSEKTTTLEPIPPPEPTTTVEPKITQEPTTMAETTTTPVSITIPELTTIITTSPQATTISTTTTTTIPTITSTTTTTIAPSIEEETLKSTTTTIAPTPVPATPEVTTTVTMPPNTFTTPTVSTTTPPPIAATVMTSTTAISSTTTSTTTTTTTMANSDFLPHPEFFDEDFNKEKPDDNETKDDVAGKELNYDDNNGDYKDTEDANDDYDDDYAGMSKERKTNDDIDTNTEMNQEENNGHDNNKDFEVVHYPELQ